MLLGSILSFCGLIWLVSGGQPGVLLQHGIGKGELMMLLATASYALYGVLTKRWAIALPNWQSLYVQILFGVLLLLPNFLMAQDVGLNGHNLPLVLFAGIPASIIARSCGSGRDAPGRQHRLDLHEPGTGVYRRYRRAVPA